MKSTQGIWRLYLAGKRAALFHCEYAVLDGFFNALKIPTEVLTVLGCPALFSLEALQTMSDLVMSTSPGKKVLKEDKVRKLRSPIVNHGAETLSK